MRTNQLAARLSRNLVFRTPGAASADQLQELADSISKAIHLFYELAPDIYRRTTVSATIGGSRTVSVAVQSRATEVSSGTPFLPSDRGKSVMIGDDGNYNEIVSTVGWIDEYMGSSVGTVTATIWEDAVLFADQTFDRIVNDPMRMKDGVRMVRDDDLCRWGHGSRWHRSIGEPERYALDLVGDSQSEELEPLAILRVDPIPASPVTLRFQVDLSSVRIGVGDMAQEGKGLPMTDRDILSIVMPLAQEELSTGRLWDEGAGMSRKDAKTKGALARGMAERKPAFIGRPRHRIGTPRGY